jgi:hypothetical protein
VNEKKKRRPKSKETKGTTETTRPVRCQSSIVQEESSRVAAEGVEEKRKEEDPVNQIIDDR